MVHSNVLVLNRSYLPVHLTSVKRAFVLLYRGVAKALGDDFQTFDFSELRVAPGEASGLQDEVLGTVQGMIRVPRIIVLDHYDHVPRRYVRFSRQNVLMRDGFTCQYCGARLPRAELNLDHVVPRALGGKTTWENVVASCFECNRNKGSRTLAQARISLLKKPVRPRWTHWTHSFHGKVRYKEWQPFLHVVEQRKMNDVNFESTRA